MTPDKKAIGARLRAAREAPPYWSRADLARRLRDAADPRDRDRMPHVPSLTSMIKQWEAGKWVPNPRYRALYARAMGRTEDELFPLAPQAPAATSTGTVDRSPTPNQGDDDVKRRRLIQDAGALTVGAVVAPVLTTLTEAWQASQPRLPGATVSQAMIDDWAAAYAVHIRSYTVDAPEVVLAGLTRDWTEMAPHLANRQPENVRRDLAHAAAKHAYLIAGTAVQLRDMRL